MPCNTPNKKKLPPKFSPVIGPLSNPQPPPHKRSQETHPLPLAVADAIQTRTSNTPNGEIDPAVPTLGQPTHNVPPVRKQGFKIEALLNAHQR